MSRRRRRRRPGRRRMSLGASNAGPIMKLIAVIVAILAFAALVIFVALPNLLPLLGIDYNAPFVPTPTPAPTARPTPTPHPVATSDLAELQTELVLPSQLDYAWYSDPVMCGGSMLFAAGNAESGNVPMSALLSYNIKTGATERLNVKLENDSFVSPTWNGRWIVYLDGKIKGGGVIRAVNRETQRSYEVKEVFVGQPKLMLDGDVLIWTEQTGTTMDKLFACDLKTMETATVQMFSNSRYGLSKASIAGGQILYADEDPNQSGDAETSAIYCVNIEDGKVTIASVGTYVHDPRTNGRYWAWLDSDHGENAALYVSRAGGESPRKIAQGVVDFEITSTFVAYGAEEKIYVYFFDDRSTHEITPQRESAQFVSASENYVLWTDVTFRERDVLKFAKIE